jgi:hypothetical protein
MCAQSISPSCARATPQLTESERENVCWLVSSLFPLTPFSLPLQPHFPLPRSFVCDGAGWRGRCRGRHHCESSPTRCSVHRAGLEHCAQRSSSAPPKVPQPCQQSSPHASPRVLQAVSALVKEIYRIHDTFFPEDDKVKTVRARRSRHFFPRGTTFGAGRTCSDPCSHMLSSLPATPSPRRRSCKS